NLHPAATSPITTNDPLAGLKLARELVQLQPEEETANYFLWVALKYDPSIIMTYKDEIDQQDLDFVQALK
ncbi:MAG: hypothetical protein ONB05_04245, partial [candidate division KSB1 bacterium]|nr:hypothetical protein [candidate division KSB1 bacterium]